jgi:hypothetical protein
MFFKANKAFVPSISYQNMHIGKKKAIRQEFLSYGTGCLMIRVKPTSHTRFNLHLKA